MGFLDPVYTVRALAGLINLIRQGHYRPDWPTGGTACLFARAIEMFVIAANC